MNAILWIRNPYPFRYDEVVAIQEALRSTISPHIVYMRDWPVDYIEIDGTNITTCKQLALTVKTIHRQWAYQERANSGRVYCLPLEVDIRERGDARPEWAKVKPKVS